jgi:hypothetical protein
MKQFDVVKKNVFFIPAEPAYEVYIYELIFQRGCASYHGCYK